MVMHKQSSEYGDKRAKWRRVNIQVEYNTGPKVMYCIRHEKGQAVPNKDHAGDIVTLSLHWPEGFCCLATT